MTQTKNLIVTLDLNGVDTPMAFIEQLAKAFVFFDDFGKNTNATLDCLCEVYNLNNSLSKITNPNDSETILEFVYFTENKKILPFLLELLSSANARLREMGFEGRFSLRPIYPLQRV